MLGRRSRLCYALLPSVGRTPRAQRRSARPSKSWSKFKTAYEAEFVQAVDADLADVDPLQVERDTLEALLEIRNLGSAGSPEQPE